ncbi:RAD9, HUS1, RAD1-interacting nuclear orphan protein 1 isoform 1-T3 [Mantella aurantiaca]
MPAKKRSACNPKKGRLIFLESPEQGPVHEYGIAPPKAENPICVPSKPVDGNTSTSWVTPQFEQTIELHFPARRRLRHATSNSTLQSRPGDTSRNALRVPTRKQSVCKFPSLSFASQNTTSVIQTESFCTRRKPKQKLVLQTPLLESPPQRSCDNTASPPDIKTPDVSPTRDTLLAPATSALPTPVSRKETAQGAADTPQGKGEVLAEDTPEHEYGVRVTWRRRQGLMKYLKSKGRLQSSQIQVKL